MKQSHIFSLVSVFIGVISWSIVVHLSGRKEAWDAPQYFSFAYPAICVMAAVLGFYEPNRSWRWGVFPFLAQALWMVMTQREFGLLPLGLIFFGFLSLPAILTARAGAWLGRRYL